MRRPQAALARSASHCFAEGRKSLYGKGFQSHGTWDWHALPAITFGNWEKEKVIAGSAEHAMIQRHSAVRMSLRACRPSITPQSLGFACQSPGLSFAWPLRHSIEQAGEIVDDRAGAMLAMTAGSSAWFGFRRSRQCRPDYRHPGLEISSATMTRANSATIPAIMVSRLMHHRAAAIVAPRPWRDHGDERDGGVEAGSATVEYDIQAMIRRNRADATNSSRQGASTTPSLDRPATLGDERG